MATSSSITWVVASTGKSTRVGPKCSSAQSSSSPVVAPQHCVARRRSGSRGERAHRALRVRAAETEASVSDLVNGAVRQRFGEGAAGLAAFEARALGPVLAFEEVLKDLKRRDKL